MRVQQKAQQQGFTLIELMIVVAIVAILAGVGGPVYRTYVERAEAMEAMPVLASAKFAITSWVNVRNSGLNKAGCSAGVGGIPANIVAGSGAITTLTILNGDIDITDSHGNTIDADIVIADTGVSWDMDCSNEDAC